MTKGFTLIEVLVTLAVTSILLGSGFFISLDAYESTLYEREFHLFIQILEKVRSLALNNVDEMPHGLKLKDDKVVIFSGDFYDPEKSSNEEIERNKKIIITGPDQIIFHNVDAITSTTSVFEISDGIRSKTISVGHEGEIDW